jgi:hypothetical protein
MESDRFLPGDFAGGRVHGHLHVRATHFRDGVRFEEVSLGYPRDWSVRHGVAPYLRQILPSPRPPAC